MIQNIYFITKRFILLVLLAIYMLIIPFFFVNCASNTDIPYVVSEEADDPDATLNRCLEEDEFLYADCIDPIVSANQRQNEESAAVASAVVIVDTVATCRTTDDEDEEACLTSSDADTFITAYEVCQGDDSSDYSEECAEITPALNTIEDYCGTTDNSSLLPVEFCDPILEYILEPSEDNITTDDEV